mmetsp:Transcript_8429/g.25325  ORF Transcript_8429/g.25325 Transcript_8429/m.25325 type:complete len:364 (-) Transcript_8429:246-1337(-)
MPVTSVAAHVIREALLLRRPSGPKVAESALREHVSTVPDGSGLAGCAGAHQPRAATHSLSSHILYLRSHAEKAILPELILTGGIVQNSDVEPVLSHIQSLVLILDKPAVFDPQQKVPPAEALVKLPHGSYCAHPYFCLRPLHHHIHLKVVVKGPVVCKAIQLRAVFKGPFIFDVTEESSLQQGLADRKGFCYVTGYHFGEKERNRVLSHEASFVDLHPSPPISNGEMEPHFLDNLTRFKLVQIGGKDLSHRLNILIIACKSIKVLLVLEIVFIGHVTEEPFPQEASPEQHCVALVDGSSALQKVPHSVTPEKAVSIHLQAVSPVADRHCLPQISCEPLIVMHSHLFPPANRSLPLSTPCSPLS